MKLSVIVFIFWPEEENLIDTCLKSLNFANEIIVIDNGATKKTLDLVRKYTDKIYFDTSKSFASHHNLGKNKASGDWLLYIDSDERISKSLAKEIKNISNEFAAYQLRRENFILGQHQRFGDRYPDFVTRLFKKSALIGWAGDIHESSQVHGPIGRLEGPLYHLTHRDIYSMLQKTINFSEREARLRLAAGHASVVWWRLIRVFLSEFYVRIVRYQGWRAGTEGFLDGIFQAFSLFIVYARLWELQRKHKLEETYKESDKKILSGEL